MPLHTHKDAVTRVLAEACVNGEFPRQSASLSLAECEWAGQAIEVLNEFSLTDLVQQVPHEPSFRMAEAVRHAMELAAAPDSLLYALGPHPVLVQRILRVLGTLEKESDRNSLVSELQMLSSRLSNEHAGSAFGLLWRTVGAALVRDLRAEGFVPADPRSIAEDSYYRCKALGISKANVLREFLVSIEAEVIEPAPAERPGSRTRGVVLVVFQRDSKIPINVAYGSTRIMLEVAKYMKKTGYLVVVTGSGECSLGTFEGLLYFGCENEVDVVQRVRGFGRIDTVIGVSRVDVVVCARASRGLVYHHGPHPIQGVRSPSLVNFSNIPVVCLSDSSAREQVGFGVQENNVSHVYSGFNKRIFVGAPSGHVPHRMVFAGGIVDYKGADIAIRAFEILKGEFTDAEFHVFGSNNFNWRDWKLSAPHHLRRGWLQENGTIDFAAASGDLPGLRYFGSKPSEEIAASYRKASVLVMPSRVAETFGLVSIEAQACGCIPVLPRNGAFPETMQENETGFLYEDNTPEALASEIGTLWRAGVPSKETRDRAIRFANENFAWESTGAEVLRVIERERRRSLFTRGLVYGHWYCGTLLGLYGSPLGVVAAAARKLLAPRGPKSAVTTKPRSVTGSADT